MGGRRHVRRLNDFFRLQFRFRHRWESVLPTGRGHNPDGTRRDVQRYRRDRD